MKMHLRFRALLPLAAVAMLLALANCTTDSPTEPRQQAPPSGGGGGTPPSGAWNITLTSSRPQLEVNGTRSATITIRVRDAGNQSLPPDGAAVTVTTTLGELGVLGSGANQAIVSVQRAWRRCSSSPATRRGRRPSPRGSSRASARSASP